MNYAVKELQKNIGILKMSDVTKMFIPQYEKAIQAIQENKAIHVYVDIICVLQNYKINIIRGLSEGNWSGYEDQRKRQEKALRDVKKALELLSN